jgi:hypothetical protein
LTCIRTAVRLASKKTSKWPLTRVGRAHLKSAGGACAVADEGVAHGKRRVVRAFVSSSSSVDWTLGSCRRQQHSSDHQDKSTQSIRRTSPAPHHLRHAHAAVEMARETVLLIVIQCQLGHSNLGVTS